MARGDFYPFDQFFENLGNGVHDWSGTITLKICIVDDTLTPARDDSDPKYSAYSANEVSGTNYPAGGVTLDNPTWGLVSGISVLDADDETITQSASGFSDGYWGIVYDDAATNDEAVGWLDLGGPCGNVIDDLDILIPSAGIVRVGRPAEL